MCWADRLTAACHVRRGKTWSAIGLLTGWAQQDGALVRLNDGTIAMPFAHKDK